MPLIRFRIDVLGMFHNNPNGVKHGDVVDFEEPWAERYVRLGQADYVSAVKPLVVERAVAPQHHVETAKLEIPPEVEALAKPKPLDEPEPEEPEHDDPPVPKRRVPPRRAGR